MVFISKCLDMRYKITIEIHVDANNNDDALSKGQKLCDVLNAKDSRNKARVPKMVIMKDEGK